MLQTIRHFLSLIRFSHTLFALPFALLAALMAWRMQAIDHFANGDQINISESSTSFDIPLLYTSVFIHDTYVRLPFIIRWQELVGILLCMVFARSAAMAFNRLVDWKFDAENPRTVKRHIPAGLMSRGTVIGWTMASRRMWVSSMGGPLREPAIVPARCCKLAGSAQAPWRLRDALRYARLRSPRCT